MTDNGNYVSILKNGSAEYQWVKKSVSGKEAQFMYASPSYRHLATTGTWHIFAFRRLVSTNEPLPPHLELCNAGEISTLEDSLNKPI